MNKPGTQQPTDSAASDSRPAPRPDRQVSLSLADNTIFNLAGQAASRIFDVLTFLILARYLGVDDFGAFSFAFSLVSGTWGQESRADHNGLPVFPAGNPKIPRRSGFKNHRPIGRLPKLRLRQENLGLRKRRAERRSVRLKPGVRIGAAGNDGAQP